MKFVTTQGMGWSLLFVLPLVLAAAERNRERLPRRRRAEFPGGPPHRGHVHSRLLKNRGTRRAAGVVVLKRKDFIVG